MAAGLWSKAELAKAGVDVPLVTVRHQVAQLARPVDRLPLHPAMGDIAQSFSFRPDGPRMSLMGSATTKRLTWKPTTSCPGWTTWQRPRKSWRGISRQCPTPTSAAVGWSVRHHARLAPHPGPSPGVEGIYCAMGFSGHGFKLSPMIGLTMAELIAEGSSSTIDISPLLFSRFEEGDLMESSYRYRVLA